MPEAASSLVGEHVCVHGRGFGNVVEHVEREEYPGPYIVVEIQRRDYHKPSGKLIDWKERVTVLLDVYPPHFSRGAIHA